MKKIREMTDEELRQKIEELGKSRESVNSVLLIAYYREWNRRAKKNPSLRKKDLGIPKATNEELDETIKEIEV